PGRAASSKADHGDTDRRGDGHPCHPSAQIGRHVGYPLSPLSSRSSRRPSACGSKVRAARDRCTENGTTLPIGFEPRWWVKATLSVPCELAYMMKSVRALATCAVRAG